MNTYKLSGTYRQQYAIGEMESFQVVIKAENTRQAMDDQREIYYNDGYDHILFKSCKRLIEVIPDGFLLSGKDIWLDIPMIEALGLE